MINFKKACLPIALGVSVVLTGCSAIKVSETDYQKDAIVLDKNSELFSHPDKFKRKTMIFTAPVTNIKQSTNHVELLFEANGLSGNTPIDVHYTMKDCQKIIEKGEIVRVLGEFQKIDSNSKMLPETSVMEFQAWHVVSPLWNKLQIGSYKSTTDSDGMLSFNKMNINLDSLDVTGSFSKGNDYNVGFKGSIKDDGTGAYECFDEYDQPLGINGAIKMPDYKTVEIDTPQVQYKFSVYRRMGYSEDRINAYVGDNLKTMPAGHYVYIIN